MQDTSSSLELQKWIVWKSCSNLKIAKMNFLKLAIYGSQYTKNKFGENFSSHKFLPLRYFNLILEKEKWENNSALSLFAYSIMIESFLLGFSRFKSMSLFKSVKFKPFSFWKFINLFCTAWNYTGFHIGKPNCSFALEQHALSWSFPKTSERYSSRI